MGCYKYALLEIGFDYNLASPSIGQQKLVVTQLLQIHYHLINRFSNSFQRAFANAAHIVVMCVPKVTKTAARWLVMNNI